MQRQIVGDRAAQRQMALRIGIAHLGAMALCACRVMHCCHSAKETGHRPGCWAGRARFMRIDIRIQRLQPAASPRHSPRRPASGPIPDAPRPASSPAAGVAAGCRQQRFRRRVACPETLGGQPVQRLGDGRGATRPARPPASGWRAAYCQPVPARMTSRSWSSSWRASVAPLPDQG